MIVEDPDIPRFVVVAIARGRFSLRPTPPPIPYPQLIEGGKGEAL